MRKATISNLMYLSYPGVASYEIHPLSYRAVQTLLFHSIMTVYGLLTLFLDSEHLDFKRWYRPLVILGMMTVWAMLGNAFYSGAADGYNHDFNWFFIKADPFGLLSEEIAIYVAPWLNLISFFGLDMILRLIFVLVRRARRSTLVYRA